MCSVVSHGFRVEDTVIEKVDGQVARAKAQATDFGRRKPGSRHSASFCVLPRPKKGHTHDYFSVCSVVSDGFGLKTQLLNRWMRDLPGLKPRLRFLDRANRGHVIPRHSAFFRGQKKDTPTITFPCVPW